MLARLFRHPAALAGSTRESADVNVILSEFLDKPVFAQFLAYRLARAGGNIILLGGEAEATYLEPALVKAGVTWRLCSWDFGQSANLESFDPKAKVVVFKVATLPEHWTELQVLRHRLGIKLIGINELLLPLSLLLYARERLPYSVQDLNELLIYYIGQSTFGAPLQTLADVFPLRGKSVIEFGPLDGGQTAFLVNSSASRVMCVEARPENASKVMVLRQAMGWDNVDIRMDDFHNADASSVGRFDLAFAHGVYYHSIAPFVFLENLISLSDNIYLGGYCATESNPKGEFQQLSHGGRSYRVKRYVEGGRGDFYAGINTYAYFFQGEDLLSFFQQRGYATRILQDQTFGPEQCAGRYIRFFASRCQA